MTDLLQELLSNKKCQSIFRQYFKLNIRVGSGATQ